MITIIIAFSLSNEAEVGNLKYNASLDAEQVPTVPTFVF